MAARSTGPEVIERQHPRYERDEVRGAYNRAEYLPERRAMMQSWADHLDALVAGARAGSAASQAGGT